MHLRALLACFAGLFLLPIAARAQISFYTTIAADGFTTVQSSNPTFQNSGVGSPGTLSNYHGSCSYTCGTTLGVGMGLTLSTPIKHSRFTAGLDIRGSDNDSRQPNSTGVGGDYIVAGVRAAFVPRTHRLRPYVVLGGGHLGAYGTVGYQPPILITSSCKVFVVFYGLDLRITRHIDARLIELGGVHGSGHFDGYNGSATVDMTSFNTGVVFNFNYPFRRGSRLNPAP